MDHRQPSHHYRITCITHDEAVLHCLDALARFAEGTGRDRHAPMEPPVHAWPHDWDRDSGRVTFDFSEPRRRDLFLGEATRLLSGKWTRMPVEDRATRP